jgi:hypothetical protein
VSRKSATNPITKSAVEGRSRKRRHLAAKIQATIAATFTTTNPAYSRICAVGMSPPVH